MEKKEEIDLFGLVKEDDFPVNSEEKLIRIMAFTAVVTDLQKNTYHYKLFNSHCILFYGTIKYFSDIKQRFICDQQGFKILNDELDLTEKKSDEGWWLAFVIPYGNKTKGIDLIEHEVIGLFSLFFGQNYTYSLLFKNDYHYGTRNVQLSGPTFINPTTIRMTEINTRSVDFFNLLLKNYGSSDIQKQNQIQSALRWYQKAAKSNDTASFICLWTAVEILGKDGNVNLNILKRKMIQIYSIAEEEIEDVFCIGHIESFRGKVIHKGFDEPMHGHLLEYLRCLIKDLTIFTLAENRTQELLIFCKEHIQVIREIVT